MALQVWLPLNGNMNNQGLNPISMVGSPNSWGSGKIGKCATFSPTSATPTTKIYNTTTSLNYVNEDFSWSVWINPSSTIYGTSYIFTVGRADAGGYGYGMGVSSGSVYCWFGNKNWSISITHNVWTHISFCRKGNTIKLYKNGVLDSTQTFSGTLPTYSDGNGLGLGCFHYSGSIYAYNGSINDFRIYNHCLSPKEVKEISKGLVLHYKMDDGHVEPTTNLAPYPTPGGAVNPGWDTSKHPNAISVNGWSSGYNGGVGSPEKGYHACWNVIDGIPTIVYRNLNSEIGSKGRWLGVSGGVTSNIAAGATYTISFEAKSANSGVIDGGIYYNNSGNGFHDGSFWVTTTSEWKKYSKTFTAKVAHAGTLYIYGNNGNEGIKYVRNVQIELKDHATPYTPTSRSETTVYDCSGFGNDGSTTSTTAPITNSDTARYSSAWGFNGTNYITLTNLPTFIDMSVSFWMKPYSSGQTACLINYRNAVGNDIAIFLIGGNVRFDAGGQTQFTNYVVTTDWQHVCVTFNNSTSKKQLYINGVLKQEVTMGSSIGVSSSFGTIGSSSNGSVGSVGGNVYSGILSDYRIYATPLSAEDVKELYNTSAMVCNNGTVMAYSLEE